MSGRALRTRRRRIAEGKCPRDRRIAVLEPAGEGASQVYSFEIDPWAVRRLALDYEVESLTAS